MKNTQIGLTEDFPYLIWDNNVYCSTLCKGSRWDRAPHEEDVKAFRTKKSAAEYVTKKGFGITNIVIPCKEFETGKGRIREMLNDEETSFDTFYDFLHQNGIGNWDRVNNEQIIKQYLNEMIEKGVHVSHIVKALEENPSDEEVYGIWLGNSMETPTPINSKKDLIEELEIEM